MELIQKLEAYDPKLSPDNRGEELELHRDIVMETGVGSLTCDFDRTFVRSIDAALTLVPERWALDCLKEGEVGAWYVNLRPRDWIREWVYAKAASTPALAICIAALRAQEGDKP